MEHTISLTEEQLQERYLEDHIQVVQAQAFLMKKSLDSNNLRDALKFSSTMLGELKTSKLSPRNYFNLYMLVFDELALLEAYFIEEQKKGRKMADLYESV
jgi:vacuolar protein sorting-associated protein 35